jgi:hypothetical protein
VNNKDKQERGGNNLGQDASIMPSSGTTPFFKGVYQHSEKRAYRKPHSPLSITPPITLAEIASIS